MKRIALATLALPFLAAPAHAGGGCASDGPSAQRATTTVVIDHVCFGPEAALVAPGATVTWRNESGTDHNISGPGIRFADLPAGATYQATFAAPGLYPYACMLHPGMSGVVVVGGVPTPPVAPAAAVLPATPSSSSDSGTPRAVWVGVVVGAAALAVAGWRGRRLVTARA